MVSVNEQLQEYDRMINGSSDNISENAIIKTLIEQGIKEFPAFLSILKKEHFSINNNAIIYTKMCEMFENNEDWSFVEIVTNIEYAGVKKHLIDVFTNPLYFANLDISLRSAYKIIEKNRLEFQKKRLETFSKELNKENVDTALSEIFDLLSNKDQQKKDNINEIIPTYIENIFNPKPKVTTKFNKLNEFNGGGWKKGNIHTFAGRPGQGKTAMLVSMVNYDLSLNRKVGILSLEMSTDQIITNLISNKTKIDNQRIDNYVVEAQKSENFRITVSSAINDLQMSNLYIDDVSMPTAIQIYNKIKLWKLNYDIDIIYLDYLDKIDHNFTKGGVKTYAMQDTMNWLSRSAKECDIPFIMLAQIDRNADKKGDITNFVLADLSDSKSVEQESYTVSFIVRPEKYGETKYTTSSGQEIDAKGLAVLNVTKNRGGKTGKLLLNFTDYCTLFENYQMPTEDEPKKIKHYNENEDESAF